MSATTATLNDHRVTSATIDLPAWGAWHADVSLDGEVKIAGAVTLVVNDLTLKGTILSGGPLFGRSRFRVVGGAGGWGKILPKNSYANDAGVRLSTILNDAAKAAGETLDASTVPTIQLGPAWTRDEGAACFVLNALAPSAWYVGEDGVTRLGQRKASTFAGQATRIEPVDQATKRLTIASESIATLVPGVVVDGLSALDVTHEISPDGLRTTIRGALGIGSAASRLLAARRAQLEQLDPNRRFRGTYEYRVVTRNGNRLNLQIVLVSTGMPDLQNVPVRPGLAGGKADVKLGSRVLVTWANADRARPLVLGCDDADSAGFLPDNAAIDATTSVNVGPSAGAVNLAGGSDAVALATPTNNDFTALKNAFQSWTPVSMDGGAALKALLTTMLATGWPSSVSASKVKAT